MVDRHSHIELYEPKTDGDWADFAGQGRPKPEPLCSFSHCGLFPLLFF